MTSAILTLRKEYEIKQNNIAIAKTENIQKAYEFSPRLKEIDNEIKALGIQALKSSTSGNSSKEEREIIFDKMQKLKKEKEKELKKTGISIEPTYECEICKDTGYITENGLSKMCSCMKQKLIDANYNRFSCFRLKEENFDNFDLSLYSEQQDIKKYGTSKSPRDNMKQLLKLSKSFIEHFDDPKTNNLLFVGSTGVGKTFLSGCIANEFLKNGRTVIYQTAPLLLDNIFEYKFNSSKNARAKELYDSLFSTNLLIIDDLRY